MLEKLCIFFQCPYCKYLNDHRWDYSSGDQSIIYEGLRIECQKCKKLQYTHVKTVIYDMARGRPKF